MEAAKGVTMIEFWTIPAEAALNELSQAPIVRFSLLALNSICFFVDPFAAIPSFLAITESADPVRRKRMARKGAGAWGR
jgi:hypothetical protein